MKITNIKKKFGSFTLDVPLLDFSETIIYGIIGPNGCGKTTVLKLMAGLQKPDDGQIEYEDLTRRDVTMVFKKPYLIGDTVLKNLTYPLALRGIKPNKEIIDEYLEMAGLADSREKYAPSLSGGQQQKLSLVRALIFSPKIIFIDEGFSNMDIESVVFFENYILNRQKEHPITWIIVSHQISDIKRLCDYVYFMCNGTVEEEGTTDELLLNPKAPNLKRFLQYS